MQLSILVLLTALAGAPYLEGAAVGATAAADRVESTAAAKAPIAQLGGFAHISKRVLQDLLHRDVRFNERVAESILKMTTRGTARVDCQIGLELVPNPHAANLRLLMTGRVIMDDAVSTMRSVRIYSSSQTQVIGHKDVLLDTRGLRLLPTRATGHSSIQVHDVSAPRPLLERIAWRRVGKMQPQAEHAAGQRAARRSEQQLEAEAGKPLGQLNREYVQNVYKPLTEQGAFPDVRLATTSDHLSVRFVRRAPHTDERHSAATSPPTPAYDLAVCVNDSFLNEMLARFVAGHTHSDRHFAEFMETLTGKIPRPLWVHDRTAPWSVTAAKERPLVVGFVDNQVSIALRIDRATHGEERLERPLQISATYTLEASPDGPHLIRKGPIAVDFVEHAAGGEMTAREAELKKFLERKFSGVFLEDLYFDGLMPPEGGSWGKLRRLALKQFTANNGWLAIGYELRSTPPATKVQNLTARR